MEHSIFIDSFFKPEIIVRYAPDILRAMLVTIEVAVLVVVTGIALGLLLAVVRSFTPTEIRAQMLANLHRWKAQGTWGPAYDEWQAIAQSEDDGALFAAMLGRDDNAVRLRQSMPGVGLLPQVEVRKLNEEAGS